MGLRHQVGQLLSRRISKLRGKKRTALRAGIGRGWKRRSSAAPMAGFWTQFQPSNPNLGPQAGTQVLHLLSNGEVMLAQDTFPNAGANFTAGPTQTTWFRYSPDGGRRLRDGAFGLQNNMNTARLYFPSVVLPDSRIFAIGGEYSPTFGFLNDPEIYNPLTNTWTRVPDMPAPPTQFAIAPSLPPTTPRPQFKEDPLALLPNGDVLGGMVQRAADVCLFTGDEHLAANDGNEAAQRPERRRDLGPAAR